QGARDASPRAIDADPAAARPGAAIDTAQAADAGTGGESLAARGESVASHRDGRGAPRARRDDREYRLYLSEEQRSPRGCIAPRMQPDFHHGLLGCRRPKIFRLKAEARWF